MNIFDQAVENYCEYAAYVNSFRALPSIIDGFKPIHRRLIITAIRDAGASKGFVKSARVCGTLIAKYHPHGESSSYDALVKMTRTPSSPFTGHGNFGTRNIRAAAMRYTEVKLSDVGKSLYLTLIDHAPHFENDLGNSEPSYLPSVIPYSLIAGSFGIGVGTQTRIPQFELKSLLKYAQWVINGESGKIPEIKLNYLGNYSYDPEILTEGKGSIIYHPKVEWGKDADGRSVLIISEVSPMTNATRTIHGVFRNELADDTIFIRDETTNKLRIVVGRCQRVRRITDQEILDRLLKKLTRRMHVCLNWSTPDGVRTIGVYGAIKTAISYYTVAHKADVKRQLYKLDDEVVLYRVADKFVEMLMGGWKKKDIISNLEITSDQFSLFSQRSINAMKKYKYNTGIKDVKSKIKFLKEFSVADRLSSDTQRFTG